MANKLKQKNIFESSFDSFEFDDGFLMKIDSELQKNKINEKQTNLLNKSKKEDNLEKDIKKVSDTKADYYDLPLFIEDLDESDFFDSSKNQKKSKKANCQQVEKQKKETSRCLSPILRPKPSNKLNISSSTPIKPNENLPIKEKPSTSQKPTTNSEFDYLEADMFEDWNVDEVVENNTPKETVTFSQAMKLIEEAELARDQDEGFNQSFNLLTGEVVGGDEKTMSKDSFELPKSEKCNEEFIDDSVIIEKEIKVECKPAAAQKLNFGSEKVSSFESKPEKEFDFGDSDDDFDFLTQELLKKPKFVTKCNKQNSKSPISNKVTLLKDSDLNDSTDEVVVLNKRRRKCIKVIESDGTDSPSPKAHRQNITKKRQNIQEKLGRSFIESEADVSDEVSSDEAEEDGEYDKSFLDEESYFSQNNSANMTAKYLESVKTIKRHGSFKIPAPKPYIPEHIFSQIPEESGTDYEIDSFCVPNDVEEEPKTELSELEIAERILEMDRKKRKKKRIQNFNYN